MATADTFRSTATVVLLLALAPGTVAAQTDADLIVQRSENSSRFQVWIVDPESGVAAFYGGDILAICREEPDAHDLLDVTEVYEPQEVATMFAAQGTEIGASLWSHAPPFSPRLCADILSREGPLATGTAMMTSTGRFPQTWGDPRVESVYGVSATGTMETPEGETLRVNAHWRCGGWGDDQRCVQGVVVNRQ